MAEAKARNPALIIAAALLFIAALINFGSGLQTFFDRPGYVEEGAVPAAITYWALSSVAFGAIQALGALLLLQRRKEGETVSYVMIVLAATYWVATLGVRPAQSVIALVVLAVTAVLIAMNRDALQ